MFGYLAERRAGGAAAKPAAPEGRMPTTPAPDQTPRIGVQGRGSPPEPIAASYLAAIERLLAGDEDDARGAAEEIVERNRQDWIEPAYIAAEADYARLKKPATWEE